MYGSARTASSLYGEPTSAWKRSSSRRFRSSSSVSGSTPCPRKADGHVSPCRAPAFWSMTWPQR